MNGVLCIILARPLCGCSSERASKTGEFGCRANLSSSSDQNVNPDESRLSPGRRYNWDAALRPMYSAVAIQLRCVALGLPLTSAWDIIFIIIIIITFSSSPGYLRPCRAAVPDDFSRIVPFLENSFSLCAGSRSVRYSSLNVSVGGAGDRKYGLFDGNKPWP